MENNVCRISSEVAPSTSLAIKDCAGEVENSFRTSQAAVQPTPGLWIDSSDHEFHWAEFIHRTQPVIAGVITKRLRRRGFFSVAVVDDLVQETYLKLCAGEYRALREFRCKHENALFGFLKVVASNVVRDYFRIHSSQKRGNGKEAEVLEDTHQKSLPGGSVEDDVERKILLREIDSCLRERDDGPSSSRDSMIFWLYYRDGLTARAIAQLPDIDLTVKGVESTIHRLTNHLRIRLNRPTLTRT